MANQDASHVLGPQRSNEWPGDDGGPANDHDCPNQRAPTAAENQRAADQQGKELEEACQTEGQAGPNLGALRGHTSGDPGPEQGDDTDLSQDRKSTRLNS